MTDQPTPLDDRHLARLEQLANDARPDCPDEEWGDPETWRGLGDVSDTDFAVASYLAASRPSVVLALIAEIRAERKQAELWRARARIRPSDVEEAGTTRAQARAWMFARGFTRPSWWQDEFDDDLVAAGDYDDHFCHPDEPADTITMPIPRVDVDTDGAFTVTAAASIARLIDDASIYVDLPHLDILAEMTAMVLDGEA